MLSGASKCMVAVVFAGLMSMLMQTYATGTETSACGKINGEWRMTFTGQSCEGESESGTFTLLVKNDCTFTLRKNNVFPFIGSNIFSGKSIDVDDSKISVAADIALDDCREVKLTGSMENVDGGTRIIGKYHYDSRGGGDVEGVRVDPEN